MFKSSKMHRSPLTRLALILLCASLPLMSLVLLASCNSNPTQPQTPLLKPIVRCDEHAPREPLPEWPAHVPDRMGLSDEQYIQALEQHISIQTGWAVRVAGITQRNTMRANATADCLDKLRAAGTIL